MRMHLASLLVLISVGLSMSCSYRVELKKAEAADLKHVQEYVNSPMGRYSSQFGGVFYAGSDDTHDYIAIKHGPRPVKVFKTGQGELRVEHRMAADGDAAKWVDVTSLFPAPR
jgi:hypothetical protein